MLRETHPVSKCHLSVIVPCYNEAETIEKCIEKLLDIEDENLKLDIIIVDDKSKDDSLGVIKKLAVKYSQIMVCEHKVNKGKGAALRTGFQHAVGDYVAIQDADLEYDPNELKLLINPLKQDIADVVFGSRYLSGKAHRVLYFWHTLINKTLTLISNMFTDLNLTDMETCYKVFRREIIQKIKIKENRFGFEPEIVAKIAELNVRIYEIGISYYARTYAEGKKIGWKDGISALYCIFKYNAHKAPVPIQFLIYFFIGGTAGVFNLVVFLTLLKLPQFDINYAVISAFVAAAALNYLLCIVLLFRHNAKWNSFLEILIYILVVVFGGLIDLYSVKFLVGVGISNLYAKVIASIVLIIANYWMRRALVFPEKNIPKRD